MSSAVSTCSRSRWPEALTLVGLAVLLWRCANREAVWSPLEVERGAEIASIVADPRQYPVLGRWVVASVSGFVSADGLSALGVTQALRWSQGLWLAISCCLLAGLARSRLERWFAVGIFASFPCIAWQSTTALGRMDACVGQAMVALSGWRCFHGGVLCQANGLGSNNARSPSPNRPLWTQRRRVQTRFHLALFAIGVGLSLLLCGGILGPAAPVAALAFVPRADRPSHKACGLNRIYRNLPLGLLVAIGAGVAGAIVADQSRFGWLLGGIPTGRLPPSFAEAYASLLYGAFPWVALLPCAALGALSPTRSRASRSEPASEADGLLAFCTVWLATSIATWTLYAARYSPNSVPTAPLLPAALLVAAWLSRPQDLERPHLGLGLCLSLVLLAIAYRDVAEFPALVVGGLLASGTTLPASSLVNGLYALLGLLTLAVAWLHVRGARRPSTRRQTLVLPPLVSLGIILCWATYLGPKVDRTFSPYAALEPLVGSAKAELDQAAGSRRVLGSTDALFRSTLAAITSSPWSSVNSVTEALAFLAPPRRWLLFPMAKLGSLDRAWRKQHGEHLAIWPMRHPEWVLTGDPLQTRPSQQANPLFGALQTQVPRLEHPLGHEFGGQIRLVGLTVKPKPHPLLPLQRGFNLVWVWHCLEQPTQSWTIRVRLEGHGHKKFADHLPVHGHYATNLWESGDVVIDRQTMHVPLHYPRGSYALYVYLEAKGQTLAVQVGETDLSGRVQAGTLHVR